MCVVYMVGVGVVILIGKLWLLMVIVVKVGVDMSYFRLIIGVGMVFLLMLLIWLGMIWCVGCVLGWINLIMNLFLLISWKFFFCCCWNDGLMDLVMVFRFFVFLLIVMCKGVWLLIRIFRFLVVIIFFLNVIVVVVL